MTPQAIRGMMNQEPFRPFLVLFADGRTIEVLEREYIALSPTGNTFVVGQLDGTLALLNAAQVVGLEVPIRNLRKSKRRKK